MLGNPAEGRAQQSLKQSKGKVPTNFTSKQELALIDRYFPERHLKACMCPKKFPKFNPEDEGKIAEKKCFDLFQKITEPMLVVHSHKYCSGRMAMGELDFLICHKTQGMMLFEVKSVSTKETKHLKSRFTEGKKQLHKAAIAIKKDLEKHLKLKHKPVFYAVLMPNVSITTFEREELLNSENLASKGAFQSWLDENKTECQAFSDEEYNKCVFYFADNYRELGQSWHSIDESLFNLTPAQAKVLNGLPDEFFICGPAGSGKTEVLIHHAADEHLSKQRKLIVVHHRALADYVKWRVKGVKNITVFTFKELVDHLNIIVNRQQYINSPHASKNDVLNSVIRILTAYHDKSFKYDSIFVDEGQDMEERNWELLIDVIHNKGQSHLKRIFFDNNQMVSYSYPPKPSDSNVYHLTEVIRNTINVHKYSELFYQSKSGRQCKPSHSYDGPPVVWNNQFTDDDLKSFSQPVLSAIFDYIDEMWKELETVSPMDITLLVENEGRASALACKINQSVMANAVPFSAKKMVECLYSGEWPAEELGQNKCGVTVESVIKYKGIGAKAVILLVSPENIKAKLIEKIYSGVTRSSCKLVVIMPNRGHKELEKKIGKTIPTSTIIDEPMDIDENANLNLHTTT